LLGIFFYFRATFCDKEILKSIALLYSLCFLFVLNLFIFNFIFEILKIKVVIGDTLGQIKIYNTSSLSLVNSFQAHSNGIIRIKQSPFNTNYVATSSYDATVKIWNISSSFNWTLITTYSQHSSSVRALEWLDIDTLASAGVTDQTIKLWSPTTGQTKLTIKTNSPYVWSLKLLNTNIHLAAGLENGDINIYTINDGNLVSSLKAHTSDVEDLVQISADLLASSSHDGTVRIWNLTTNTCKFILRGHTNSVRRLKQITSNILASGSYDATIKLWDIASGQLIRTLTGHTNWIYWSVDLLNSQILVSGSGDETIKLWNWSTGECLSTIQTPGSRIWSLAVINFDQQQTTTTTQTSTSTMSSKFSFFFFSF
jgi:WD40 repeat protein